MFESLWEPAAKPNAGGLGIVTESTIEETIKRLIVERLQFQGLEATEIHDDTPLFDGGLGLDSVDALELVLALEKEFGIKVDNEQIDDTTLRDVTAIKQFVLDAQRGASC
ncbi:MAG: acyl carrier protein [Planctomycetes bacterium]|nr:acyl carrier protein [Planctomycetota bacterium]